MEKSEKYFIGFGIAVLTYCGLTLYALKQEKEISLDTWRLEQKCVVQQCTTEERERWYELQEEEKMWNDITRTLLPGTK